MNNKCKYYFSQVTPLNAKCVSPVMAGMTARTKLKRCSALAMGTVVAKLSCK